MSCQQLSYPQKEFSTKTHSSSRCCPDHNEKSQNREETVVFSCPILTICCGSCRHTCCLRESQFISPEGWTTCDIWQWSIRRFIQLFQTQTHTQTHRGGGRGWRSHHGSFDGLSRLTYNCYILMCNDLWWSWYNYPPPTYVLVSVCVHTWIDTHRDTQLKVLRSNIPLYRFFK